jgi:hypothetical protein
LFSKTTMLYYFDGNNVSILCKEGMKHFYEHGILLTCYLKHCLLNIFKR